MDSPRSVRPWGPSPPASRLPPSDLREVCRTEVCRTEVCQTDVCQTEVWRWPPLPTWPATTTGANDARRPWATETALMVSLTSTRRSAASVGGAGATDSSIWPGEYSGCSWSTATPWAASASSTAPR